MIGSTTVIGLIAGISAAVLFAAAGTGSLISLALFYVATLPLYIVGLGWGWQASVAAIISGTLAIGFLVGQTGGIIFLLTFALPAGWLCYLSLLYRDTGSDSGEQSQSTNDQNRAWYPIGMLVCWVAGLGAVLTICSVLFFGGSIDGFKTFVSESFTPMLEVVGETDTQQEPDPEAIDNFVSMLAQLLPVMLAASWMTVTFANLYGGGKIALLSGRLQRPWPRLSKIEIPSRFSLVPIIGFVISFFGGWFGLLGTIVMTVAICAYTVQGLAVLHDISRGTAARSFILILVYGTLIMLAFPALILAMLGLAEPTLNLRARAEAARNKTPPGST